MRRIITATGVNIKKNIVPRTMGLISLPSNIPNFIQTILKGRSNPAFRSETKKNKTETKPKISAIIVSFKYK